MIFFLVKPMLIKAIGEASNENTAHKKVFLFCLFAQRITVINEAMYNPKLIHAKDLISFTVNVPQDMLIYKLNAKMIIPSNNAWVSFSYD